MKPEMDVDINDPEDLKKIQLTWLASVREELEEGDFYICWALADLARPLYFALTPGEESGLEIDGDNLPGWEPLDFLLRRIKQKIGGCESVEMYLNYPEPTEDWERDEGYFSDECHRFRIQIMDELIEEIKNEA